MSALLWQPPQLSGIGHQDALWNAILTHARQPLPLSDNVFAVFEPTEEPDEQALCTHIKAGHSAQAPELYIIWRYFPFESMLQASISVEDMAVIPPVLRDALIEGMTNLIAQNALQGILENGAPEIKIFSTKPLQTMKDRLPADIAWFDMNIENIAQEPIAIRIGCARSKLIALAASREIMPLAIQETAKATISIPGIYTLGSATFFPRQLAKLTEGALIVLPTLPPAQRLLRVGKTVWEFHTNGSEWILAGQRKRMQEMQRQRHKGQEVTDQAPKSENKAMPADNESNAIGTPLPADDQDEEHLQSIHGLSQDEDVEASPEAPSMDNDIPDHDDSLQTDEDPSLLLAIEADIEDEPVVESNSAPDNEDDAEDDAVAIAEPEPSIDWVDDALVREGVRLADLGITVDFDIGERDFTLAELETWQPGAIVPLDPPALQDRVEVTLRANGRTIATGDLIAIDDRLAVRLSKLLLRA